LKSWGFDGCFYSHQSSGILHCVPLQNKCVKRSYPEENRPPVTPQKSSVPLLSVALTAPIFPLYLPVHPEFDLLRETSPATVQSTPPFPPSAQFPTLSPQLVAVQVWGISPPDQPELPATQPKSNLHLFIQECDGKG